jgi:hypothetical protein
VQQSKKNWIIHEYYVCNMQQSNFLLTICGHGCIPTTILVDDLNIWFRRDLFFLNFQMDFLRTLNYFLIVYTQMEVRTLCPHTIIE